MDITKDNFTEQFDTIVQAIQESSFLAFDTEFTGLSTGQGNQPAPFDTPDERYDKLRKGANDFLLLQFGLCTFKAKPETQSYEARPYNFYIFPRPFGRQSPDRRFLCQSSSIDFLISHNFDFNKVFKDGIPYLTQLQELKMKAELEQRHADVNNQSFSGLFSPDGGVKKNALVAIPEEHQPLMDEICEKVKSYLDIEDNEPLKLPSCNAFLRRLQYQTLKSKYPHAFFETKTNEKKERYIEVSKARDPADLQRVTLDKQRIEMMEFDVQVGFTKVMRAISESGKLLVGHNMFLDVIHSLTHFFTPLPDQLEDFKSTAQSAFPKLLDTKLMANTLPFKEYFYGSALDEVRHTVQHSPFKPAKVDLVEGFEKYLDGTSFHEAGYDAYVTGCCFASLANFLGSYQTPPCQFVLPSERSVEPFINKLFLMRIADIPYLNLTGPDVEAQREHVFHVTFPVEWRANDLHQLFQPYGNVQISWLTDTTAYVGLMKRENAKIALTALQSESSVFRVVAYSSHKEEKFANAKQTLPITPSHQSFPILTTPGKKRKSPNVDLDFPVSKNQRRSITKDIHLQSPIPEVDEHSDNAVSPRAGSAIELKTQPAAVKDKLFHESEQW